ncbi:retrovirus-related Pol polyprotein from transposon 412 [Trichonephila clavipes]|nr:retrovirus-related Pol polyprotein from transposon 412 [Trichonephila clavipes]
MRGVRVRQGYDHRDNYRNILADHLPPMFNALFPGKRLVFQDDNAPVNTSRCLQTWLQEHDDEVEHLTWCPQSRDLNIFECL